jgi:hypothetical protein
MLLAFSASGKQGLAGDQLFFGTPNPLWENWNLYRNICAEQVQKIGIYRKNKCSREQRNASYSIARLNTWELSDDAVKRDDGRVGNMSPLCHLNEHHHACCGCDAANLNVVPGPSYSFLLPGALELIPSRTQP